MEQPWRRPLGGAEGLFPTDTWQSRSLYQKTKSCQGYIYTDKHKVEDGFPHFIFRAFATRQRPA